jgi:general secretion pathway protein K
MKAHLRPHRTLRSASRQRGVAIITALIVVAAATIAIAGMLWRQSVAVRKLENQNSLDQARWLARSAVAWSRLILLQDARTSTVDHLGEIWAVPLAETRVANTLNGGAGGSRPEDSADAAISGHIVDAQARFNLANLVRPAMAAGPVPSDPAATPGATPGTAPTENNGALVSGASDRIDPQAFAALQRLLAIVGQPEEWAGVMARRMTQTPRPIDFDALAAELARGQPGTGMDAAAVAALAALRPYVVLLPKPTPVNFNTASPEVMAATLASLSLSQARTLAESRDRIFFNQVADVFSRLPKNDATAANASTPVAVSTHYFEVSGQVRYGRAEYALAALVERDNAGLTRVVSLKE